MGGGMARVNPNLMDNVKDMGAFDVSACYSCGVCTASCPLSEEGFEMPRKLIRYAMLGLEDALLSSPELWLCYYCGECTRTCPRRADPGGYMMAARRYAITKYSWGKIGKVFYSRMASPITVLVLSIIAALGLWFFHTSPNMTYVDLFSLFPLDFIHTSGLVLGVVVILSALVNLGIMIKYATSSSLFPSSDDKPPLSIRIKSWIVSFFADMLKESLYQTRFITCKNKDNRARFLMHMSIFWGFVLLFAATGINFLTGVRQISAIALGVIGGVLVVIGSGYFAIMRTEKGDYYASYSDFIDWTFLILIFLAGLTGFLLDLGMIINSPPFTYWTFAIHLVIVFDLIITAPFSKFAHLVYRPMSLWIRGARLRMMTAAQQV